MCHSRDSSVSGHQEYLHQTAWLWLLMLIKLVLDQSGDWHAAICGAASVQELKMKSLHNAPDVIITTNDPFSFQNICQISSFFKKTKQNKYYPSTKCSVSAQSFAFLPGTECNSSVNVVLTVYRERLTCCWRAGGIWMRWQGWRKLI